MDVTGKSGIDGTDALANLLDDLSAESDLAAAAPRAPALYRYLADGEKGQRGEEFANLIEQLIRRLGIWWSAETYARMPILTPWCVRDRSCRYDQGPESWGAPLPTGFLRDDNSIIKKLPLPLYVRAPEGHPYAFRKPWWGFTACHVWRDLAGGHVAGEDAWLYSFVPNLVWLPRWLAPLSDRQESATQRLLQRISVTLYRDTPVDPPISAYSEASWRKLGVDGIQDPTAVDELAVFSPTEAFFERRLKSIEQFTHACQEVLAGRPLERKIVCSRYTNGLPRLNAARVEEFSRGLLRYESALKAGRAA